MAGAGIDVEIMQILTEYTAEIGNAVNKAGEKLAKQALKELKETSPKDTGAYAKGWRIKKFGEHGRFRIVLHNYDRYMLTTFLEKGFTHMPDKSRIKGREHIKPVQDRLNREFEKAVEKIINDL